MKLKKSLDPLIKEAHRLGFDLMLTRNGHIKVCKAGCRSVFCPQTPSDHRGIKNAISQLRRSHQGTC